MKRRKNTTIKPLNNKIVMINCLVSKACSSLLYTNPKIHKIIADRIKTLGNSVAGRCSRKIEIAVVK
jgi:hypothetical protein